MVRLALLAVLAACEVPQVPLDDPAPAIPADAAQPDAPDVIATPLPIARPPLAVTGMHGAPLRALAVSEDSAFAISADHHGSLRFWPSLDGKHEPVVVAARAPIALAIIHDGDGVAFAGVDDIGQVELVRLGALGELRTRTTAQLARPAVEVRALDHAFLVRCDDGSIVRVDANGARGGELHPGAHEHVTALAVRRNGALAIIDAGGKIHGHWLDVDKMRWGKVTPDLDIIPSHVELSPGHTRIAAAAYDGEEIRVIDVKTGELVYSPVVLDMQDALLKPVGFATDDQLAVSRANSISWATRPYPAQISQPFGFGVAAVGDAGAIAETEGGLVLEDATTTEPAYLGYKLASPTHWRALAGGGWLVTDGRMVAAVDGNLHTTRAYDLADVAVTNYGFYDIRFIDDHHAIATGYAAPGQEMYLFALDDGTATRIGAATGVIDYDEAHDVLAYRTAEGLAFVHYDAKAGIFGEPATVHADGNSTVMRFLEANSSDIAIVVDTSYAYDAVTQATITRVHAVHADGTLELGKVKTMTLARNFWRTNGDPDTLAGPRPTPTPHSHASPDGKLVAVFNGTLVSLRDAHGGERWSTAVAGAGNVEWDKRGALFATGAGMARIDVATGDVTAVQCGWRFGRWDKPLVAAPATMCEQSWTATE